MAAHKITVFQVVIVSLLYQVPRCFSSLDWGHNHNRLLVGYVLSAHCLRSGWVTVNFCCGALARDSFADVDRLLVSTNFYTHLGMELGVPSHAHTALDTTSVTHNIGLNGH